MESCKQREGRITATRHTRLESFMRAVLAVLISLALLPTAPLQALADEQTPSTTTENVANDGSEPAGTESSDEGSSDPDDPSGSVGSTEVESSSGSNEDDATDAETSASDPAALNSLAASEDGTEQSDGQAEDAAPLAVGDQFTFAADGVGNLTCTVLSVDPAEAAIVDNDTRDHEGADVTFPGKVTDSNGVEYTVTQLGDGVSTGPGGQGYSKLLSASNTVTIPASVKTLKTFAFYNTALTGLVFAEGSQLETIEASACARIAAGMTSGQTMQTRTVDTIVFPESLKTIGDGAFDRFAIGIGLDFSHCKNLESIGNSAFAAQIDARMEPSTWSKLETLDFSGCASLKSMGYMAFSGHNIGKIDLSGATALETLETQTFGSLSKATEIIAPPALKTVAADTFGNNPSLETIDFSLCTSFPEVKGFDNCPNLQTVKFPEGATSFAFKCADFTIGNNSYGKNTVLKNIDLPASVTTFSIEGCPNFEYANISPNTIGSLQNITIVDPELETLDLSKYTGLKSISFTGCDKLTSITGMPATLTDWTNLFKNCKSLTSVPQIPDGVTCLDGAFYGCTGITSVPEIPDSVTSMSGTFQRCTGLTEAPELPANVKNIDNVFNGCKGITEAPVIPESVKSMKGAFQGTGLTKPCNFPDGVEAIDSVFSSCSGITETPTIPDSVTSMKGAFNSTGITKFPNIPAGVTDISSLVYNCKGITEIPDLPNGITNIGSLASRTNITEVPALPDSITSMSYAFQGCTGLTESPEKLPANVTNISNAFNGCTNLTTLPACIPDSVTNMQMAFMGCYNITHLPEGFTITPNATGMNALGVFSAQTAPTKPVPTYAGENPDQSVLNYNWSGDYRKLVEADGPSVEKTYDIAADGSGLKAELWTTGELVFSGAGEAKTFSSVDEVPWKDDAASILTLRFEDDVTFTSMDHWFEGMRLGTSYFSIPDLPDSVTSMVATFKGCTYLQNMGALPASVKDLTDTFNGAGVFAFYNPPEIPDGVEKLDRTFKGCNKLKSLPAVPANVKSASEAFSGCIAATSAAGSISVPDGCTNAAGMFYGCGQLKFPEDFSIADSVTDTSDMFYNCRGLSTLPDVPANCTNAKGMFASCGTVKAIPENYVIPDGVTNAASMFQRCTSIEAIPAGFKLPSSLTDASNMFANCSKLKTIEEGFSIPAGVKNASGMFDYCGMLTAVPESLVLPAGVTDASNMFRYCGQLKSLPDTFVIPGNGANVSNMFFYSIAVDMHLSQSANDTLKNYNWAADNRNLIIDSEAVVYKQSEGYEPYTGWQAARYSESQDSGATGGGGAVNGRTGWPAWSLTNPLSIGVSSYGNGTGSEVTVVNDANDTNTSGENGPDNTWRYKNVILPGYNVEDNDTISFSFDYMGAGGLTASSVFNGEGGIIVAKSGNAADWSDPANVAVKLTASNMSVSNTNDNWRKTVSLSVPTEKLEPDTTYYLVIKSGTREGNACTWADYVFEFSTDPGRSASWEGDLSTAAYLGNQGDGAKLGMLDPGSGEVVTNLSSIGTAFDNKVTSPMVLNAGKITFTATCDGGGSNHQTTSQFESAAQGKIAVYVSDPMASGSFSTAGLQTAGAISYEQAGPVDMPTFYGVDMVVSGLEAGKTYWLVVDGSFQPGVNQPLGKPIIFEFTTEAGAGADKTALDSAIDEATATLEATMVSADGSDVPSNKKWVSQDAYDAYKSAIDKAQGVLDDGAADQDAVNAAVSELAEAAKAFQAAQKDGAATPAIATYDIGLSNASDVKATLLEDGTLVFTGHGDIQQWTSGRSYAPWYTDGNYLKIKKVRFEMDEGDYTVNFTKCFYHCENLEGIEGEFPKQMTGMNNMFAGCTKLVSVPAIPDGVSDMSNAFMGCTSFAVAPELPESLTGMAQTFSGCIALVDAPEIPAGVTSMQGTFDSTGITVAPELPEGLENMFGTFRNTKITKAPNIPSTVKSMSGAFYGCTELTEASDIKADLSGVNAAMTGLNTAFYGCTKLERSPKIECTSGELTQMNSTFFGCTSLVEAGELPDCVTDLRSTFSGCASLIKAPAIPDGVTSMQQAFSGCTSLEEVGALPETLQNMNNAFSECSSLASAPKIPAGVTNMQSAFAGTALTEAPDLPDGVTNIQSVFSGCTELVEAPFIPSGVTNMKMAFAGCNKLVQLPEGFAFPAGASATQAFSADGEFSTLNPLDTRISGKADASVLAYDWASDNRKLVLEAQGAQSALLADIDAAEKTLDATAATDNLANLPKNFIAVSADALQAYANAVDLAKTTLSDPASDDSAYADASAALASARETLEASGKAGQLDVIGVKSYNVGAPTEEGGQPSDAVRAVLCSDGKLLVAGAGSTASFNAPAKVPWAGELTAIRSYEFQTGVSPTSLMYWFYGCSNLENAGSIPEGVTDLRYAFRDCTSLEQAPGIPSSVEKMDSSFYGSAIVAAPIIPEGVTSLTNAFRNCASLAEVPLIPSTVTAMRYAFQDCTALTSLPDGFSIPEGANADGAFKLSAPYSSTNLLTTYCDPADYETLAAAYDWAASNRELVARSAAETSWNIGAVNEADVTATYDADAATLAIAGTGAMKDFASAADAPWFADFGTSIEYVTIADGVTNIGSYALGLENLKTVKGGNALATIADNAFTGATNLVAADLSGCTLTSVAANSFGTADDERAIATQRTVYVKDAASAQAIKDARPADVAAQTAVAVMNGGAFAPDTAFEAGKLAEPAQEGFTFVTWTSDEYLQHPVSAWTPLSKNVLFAKFSENQQPVEAQEYADVAQLGQGLDQTVRLLDVSKLPQSVVPSGVIKFYGETDEHYDNRFVSAFNGRSDIEFAYIMKRGTNANTGDGSYQLSFTLPYISIVNEAGETVASYDSGNGALKHLATYFNGNDTDKSGTITAVKIGVDAGSLPAGTYTLRFGKDFGANNGKSFLGKNVDFQFEVAYPDQYTLNYSFGAQTGTATVTGVTALEGAGAFDVTVPEKVTDPSTGTEYKVTAVADNAFAGAQGVTSITLPATVESIGNGAFSNMPNVEYVKVLNQGDAAKPAWGTGVFDGSASLTLYGYPTSSAQQTAEQYENVTFASLEDGIYVNGVAVADGGTVTLAADGPQATVSIMKDGDVVTDQYRGYITNTNVASHPGTAPSEWSMLTAQANGEAELVIKGADGTVLATLKIAAQGFDSDASTEGTVLIAPQGLGSNVQMVNAGEILTYAFDETKAYFDNRLTDPVGVENALFTINVAGPGSAWGIDRWDWNEFKQIADENLWLEDAQGNKVATFGDGLAWVQLSGELATQNTIMLSVDSGVMKPGETYVLVAGENFAGHNTAAKLLKAVRWTFTAAATDLADCTVSEVADQEWTGSAIEPKPEVGIETPATRIWDPAAGKDAVTPAGTRTLTEGVDYALSYADNTESGTATVTVTGKGGFTGTVERTFTIGDEPAGNKLLLADIAAAQGFLDGLAVADDAANLADGTQWATPADAEKLQAAIDEAQAVADKADATQEEFDAARDALAEELAAFKASAVKTAVVNGTALSEALDEASDAMAAVQVSKDGTDVLTTASWVTPDDMAAFAAAIAKAQDALADPARTQASIDQALADLSAAADAFDAAKKPGTKVAGGGAGEGQTPGTGTGNGTGNGGSEDGKQSTTGSNVKGLSPTGDAAPILPLTAIALISIGCTVVAMRRIMHR